MIASVRFGFRHLLLALAAWLLPTLAQAGFFQWDMVQLAASTGASCGNGTPYRFFVNRTPFSTNTVIVYEGGGACWDQAACEGKGQLHAVNPDGIPVDYMQRLDTQAILGLVTPFSARLDPFQSAPTQSWNIVFMPYCTGDVHVGSKMSILNDANPALPRVQYFRGQANIRGAAAWLRANLGRPNNLLLTGFSAGGVGATVTYGVMRDALEPRGRSQLLADSGLLFPTKPHPDNSPAYSLPLHTTIRAAWGLDDAGGMINTFAKPPAAGGLVGFDPTDLGTVTTAIAAHYPNDRFGFTLFKQDGNFSAFSYAKFYPEFATLTDPAAIFAALNFRWRDDLKYYLPLLSTQPNIGYHAAFYRNFNESHCLTIVDWSGTGIEDAGIPSIAPFVDNVLARGGTPMRNAEGDNAADYTQPLSFILTLLTQLGLF